MCEDGNLLEFLYACPVGLVEFDRTGAIGMVNPHAMKLLMPLAGAGGPENLFDALGRHAPELRNIVGSFSADHGMIRDGHRVCVDLGDLHREGRPQVISCTLVRLGEDRYMATLSDITAQVAQEHRLNLADAWFSALIDGINDYANIEVSADRRIEHVNGSFAVQTGRSYEEVVGRPVRDIVDEPYDTAGLHFSLDDQFDVAARDGWALHESWQTRRGGERYWCQRLIIARDDDSRNAAFSIVLRDVAPRDDEGCDLVTALTRDHLTGAANRMQFQKSLRQERMRSRKLGEPVSLVMFDLDHFKAINDRYGHSAGDAVLCEVVRAGLSMMPAGGTLCRLGGEEFAMLLPKTGLNAAEQVAGRLRRGIAALEITDKRISVTASFGCAELGEVDGVTDALIELADTRLYDAKRAGRDRVLAVSA